jgi:hypothetical protein
MRVEHLSKQLEILFRYSHDMAAKAVAVHMAHLEHAGKTHGAGYSKLKGQLAANLDRGAANQKKSPFADVLHQARVARFQILDAPTQGQFEPEVFALVIRRKYEPHSPSHNSHVSLFPRLMCRMACRQGV